MMKKLKSRHFHLDECRDPHAADADEDHIGRGEGEERGSRSRSVRSLLGGGSSDASPQLAGVAADVAAEEEGEYADGIDEEAAVGGYLEEGEEEEEGFGLDDFEDGLEEGEEGFDFGDDADGDDFEPEFDGEIEGDEEAIDEEDAEEGLPDPSTAPSSIHYGSASTAPPTAPSLRRPLRTGAGAEAEILNTPRHGRDAED